jgi:Carboxypeptidase regulatory-like domain
MRRSLLAAALFALPLLLLPGAAYSQEGTAEIAGVVRDASGAVLPGVTVEAASDVLIEKVRSAVTDGAGQYRIISLRPGTYSVTFTLTGFATVKHEGLQVNSGVTTTVTAEMKIGSLQETVTVTGETPVVDVQSAKRQQTITSEMLTSIPTARAANAILTLIPSMVQSGGNNVNVQLQPGMVVFGGRGGRSNEGRLQLDGLNTGASVNGGGVSGYTADVQNAAEITMAPSGGLGENEVGGPAMNIVPRTGGNSFKFYTYGSFTGDALQGSNYTAELQAAGLRAPGAINRLWDVSGSSGGPIVKDRVWYFTTLRQRGNFSDVVGGFYNLNAGDITKWNYVADTSRPAVSESHTPVQPLGRITLQAGQRNKVNLFWDEQKSGNNCGAGTSTAAPETASCSAGEFQRVQQATWTMTATSKLLLEAGIGTYLSDWGGKERDGNNRDLINVVEQCTAGCPANGNTPNLSYRGQLNWMTDWIGAHVWRASASYVTGSNNMKFGYQGAYHVDDRLTTTPANVGYRVNNLVPNQITEYLSPLQYKSRVRYHAFYAQDSWTHDRLTLQGALRYDHSWSFYPDQQIGPTYYLPQPLFFPRSDGVLGYNDITPRAGATYDVFGNGKTAVKFNFGRYLEAAVNDNGVYSRLSPSSRLATNTTRTWTDANGNFTPDCNLSNPAAQDNRAAGGDFCAAVSASTFGNPASVTSADPRVLQGWGVRPGDWQIGATLQQQVMPRVAVEVGYVRRWLTNFYATDNLAVTPANFTQFSVVAPGDPRLPGNGGYTVSGLYDVDPNLFGVTNNLINLASDYGNVTSVYNGVELSVTARIRGGLNLQAGSSLGSQVIDSCEVRAKLPEQSATNSPITGGIAYNPLNPYCHNAPGFTNRVTALGSYNIPKVDMQVSGTFASSPGIPLAANYTFSTAQAVQYLGRPLAGNALLTVNLVKPGDVWGDRLNELDFRVGKNLRFGNSRGLIALDLYNALNRNAAITNNQTFNPAVTTGSAAWLAPTAVMTARIAKITVQFDF